MRAILYSILFPLFIGIFTTQALKAQEVENVDTAFAEARELAFNGEREEARTLAYAILEKSPNYHDVRILIARTYSWDGEYTKARNELNYVLENAPKYRDAFLAAIVNEIWAEDYDAALAYSEQAIEYYPLNSEVLLKRAEALSNDGQEDEALEVLNTLEQIDPTNDEAKSLRQSIAISKKYYTFTASFTQDSYDEVYSVIRKSYVQLSRRTDYGSVIGRLNYQHRFSTSGVQAEVDFYPSIAPGLYGYVSAGFSGNSLFPEVRGGAELYKILPKSFELSAGIRYLHYSRDIFIYTGTLSKYRGNWLFTVRPYFTPNSVGVSRSLSLLVRRYLSGSDNYISFRGGFGFSPNERRFQDASGSVSLTKSQFIGLDFSRKLRYNIIPFASLDLARQELIFDPGNFVKILTFSLGAQYRF